MRVIRVFVTISAAILLATASLQAHHSFSATYDGNKPITLRGTIVKLGWQNPHAHIYVDVKNADGKVVTWEVESAGPTALMKQGLRKEDFVGQEVIIKGFLAKDGTPTVNASTFTLVEAKNDRDERRPDARRAGDLARAGSARLLRHVEAQSDQEQPGDRRQHAGHPV